MLKPDMVFTEKAVEELAKEQVGAWKQPTARKQHAPRKRQENHKGKTLHAEENFCTAMEWLGEEFGKVVEGGDGPKDNASSKSYMTKMSI